MVKLHRYPRKGIIVFRMKKTKIMANAAILLVAAVGATHLYDETLLPKWYSEAMVAMGLQEPVAGSYIGNNLTGEQWKSAKDVQKQLSAEIAKKLPNLKKSSVKEFQQEAENRLLMAQCLMAQAEVDAPEHLAKKKEELQKQMEKVQKNLKPLAERKQKNGSLPARDEHKLSKLEKRMTELQAEEANTLTLAEVLQDKDAEKLMEALGNNLDWLEQIVYTGELVRPGEVLNILKSIHKQHPDMLTNQMVRDIATATAVEFSRSGWEHSRAVERADFFIRHWKKGDLNPVFDTLPFWERRMVCGAKGHEAWGSVESLEWCNANVRLPAWGYVPAFNHCPYRVYNVFGDSIHGATCTEPYEHVYGENAPLRTKEVIGVCGWLSHYGAFAAIANGVPASTMGEPGHCAYVVKVGDKWTPAYSLSWERGMHFQLWKGMNAFTYLPMATELFSEKNAAATRLSRSYRALASAQQSTDKAKDCYQKALREQPLNMFAWLDYAEHLSKHFPDNALEWRVLHDMLCDGLAKDYPEVAAKTMMRDIYPTLQKTLADKPEELQKMALSFWDKVNTFGENRWKVEDMLNAQQKLVGGDTELKNLFSLYEKVFGKLVSNKEYSPVVLAWGNDKTARMKPAEREQMMAAILGGLGGNLGSDEEREKMLNPIIQAAEKNHDLKSFQSLSKMLPEKYTKPTNTPSSHKPFPGKLMSQGGMIWSNSTSRWDKYCAHWGILEPGVTGMLHSANIDEAWVAVMLPRVIRLTGAVVIGHAGQGHRLSGIKLQVSDTGRDNDWRDVTTFTKMQGPEFRADTGNNGPVTQYIRILRPKTGKSEFFTLSDIYIYGEQAS